ncbi:bifunctional 4-hydroxy-2-oxoglutarate aldolase/2-dehydro-3-deoxy-phosphogluconate aldolase [Flocculibacter collagenilyticus]|uniref:bifunctional 4-hydroxy-2-oxoglutarate aldolase/2-dehydro-3-deoxy-phosphogluconate aldolase n=1 Tax=Flocculibacter collagenilyticus TaxID=2744479 RepID=UPI0018F3F1A7|nr:bifunctional 4-hydroxy-2-oxoglutarate aldolase/2-dehydro-3-deoxy-phosphogluconate aldolase [Flocculibacter collagenilyticus]
MEQRSWKISAADVLQQGPVVPVLVIHDIEHAVPLAKALLAGGVKVLEVTLRTECALAAITKIANEVPEAIVGAGTVTNPQQLREVEAAGAMFAISPGLTTELLEAGNESSIALIPGISSISELMQGKDLGYNEFKFFPAEASGGVKSIKSIAGPFPTIKFCPTGGINETNYKEYLALTNVDCVGGSWIAPEELIKQGEWQKITDLCKEALA